MASIGNPGVSSQVKASYRRKLPPRNGASNVNHKLFSETQQ